MKKLYIFLVLIISVSTGISAQTPQVTPKPISGGVLNGKAIKLEKPEYPAAAMAVKASGTVSVQVLVSETGNIVSASAVSGHPLLRQAAEQAALASAFAPTTLSGQPVKVSGIIVYNFVPAKSEEVPIWGIGMFLSFLEKADPELIQMIGDEKELSGILTEMANNIPPELASEKPLIDKLAKSNEADRQTTAGELNRSLRKHFNQSELWQIEIGENLAGVLLEMVKYMRNLENNYPVSETSLRMNLEKIKTSLAVKPKDVSEEQVKHFRNIAAFSDEKDLTSPETLQKLFQIIEPLFETFADLE